MLLQNVSLWERALASDLGKNELEAHLTEIGFVVREARHAKRHMARWAAPQPYLPSLDLQPAIGWNRPEPYGIALIIAPWNYPLQLALSPLVGAIAAGNGAVIKPSELAPATSALLAELAPAYLDRRLFRVIEGDATTSTHLLQQRWDLIFYTGGARVARIVAAAAAEHLTPVILELGGKSPTYVDASADLTVTARRIAWGKWLNAGQTCIAPDYVLVHRDVEQQFLEELMMATAEQLGEPRESADFGRIVNESHTERLQGLIAGGTAVLGGEASVADRYVAPTILTKVELDSPLMRDEIFGPLLPVIPVDDVDAAIAFVNAKPKPLALYVFTRDQRVARRFERETSSGSLGINVSVAQISSPGMPFGGVGESGSGAYHGKFSFDAFSHRKGVVRKLLNPDTFALVYPPGDRERTDLVRALLTQTPRSSHE